MTTLAAILKAAAIAAAVLVPFWLVRYKGVRRG